MSFKLCSLFIGFLPGIWQNMLAEVSRNMHIYLWDVNKMFLTNQVNQHDQSYWTVPNSGHCYDCTTSLHAHEIDHIGITTWTKASSNPRVKTPPLWRKPKNPWMPMTFQGDRFCDEFLKKILTFFVFPRLDISQNVYLMICPCWFGWCFSIFIFSLWWREDSKATLNSGSCSPWV